MLHPQQVFKNLLGLAALMLQKLFGKLSSQNCNNEVMKYVSFFLMVGRPVYGDDNEGPLAAR